jgi:hypothetical protein
LVEVQRVHPSSYIKEGPRRRGTHNNEPRALLSLPWCIGPLPWWIFGQIIPLPKRLGRKELVHTLEGGGLLAEYFEYPGRIIPRPPNSVKKGVVCSQ